MKNNINNTLKIAALLIFLLVGGCKKFLEVVPKGQKIPTTLADYDALLRDEYSNQRVDVTQAVLLLNDRFETSANLSYYQLWNANYNWDENADRIFLNKTDEETYYNAYRAISTSNLIIQYAVDATESSAADRATLIAQAKILRSTNYFDLVNYYADTYQVSTASTKLAVPLILSAELNAPSRQVTIQELYNFILNDIQEALPNLRDKGNTIVHANLGAAYAFKARVLLQMGNYSEALIAANLALVKNDKLFDWVQFYQQYEQQINVPNEYTNAPSPMGYDYVENYIFRHGSSNNFSRETNIRVDRAARFETGDARFASRWKLRTVGADTYYYSITNGFYNYGGITTTEVYLIKAECQARLGDIGAAMNTLDAVRVKRILANNYTKLNATNQQDAVKLIQRTKSNELILGIMPFADIRRLNKDNNYARTFTKTENGKNLTLVPDSHLYTMTFPRGATENPGNGTITQNVNK